MLKDVSLLSEEKAIEIDSFVYTMPSSLFTETLHEGANVTGDAMLHYANRVREAVNRFFIKESDQWKDDMIQFLDENPLEVTEQAEQKVQLLNRKNISNTGIRRNRRTRLVHSKKSVKTPSLTVRKERDEL